MKKWTDEQDRILEQEYPTAETDKLAQRLGKTISAVITRANKKGIHKTREYILAHLPTGGKKWEKGHIPYNKGKKITEFMTPAQIEKLKQTQFKKGHIPKNYQPIGTEMECKGYIYVKVTDTPNVRRVDNWKLKHRLLWESVYGEIPKGHNIQFKDGNPKNITIDNLYIISQKEQMKQNSYINLGEDGAKLVKAIAVLTRKINQLENKHNESKTKRR